MKIQILSQKEGATVLVANIECQDDGQLNIIEMTKFDDVDIGKKRGVERWEFQK